MSDFIPKAPSGGIKVGGLGPKAQKLQALRDKAAGLTSAGKAGASAAAGNVKGAAGFKKTAFQRKAT